MDFVIGIDLGTTNCCVAVVEDGRPRVIEDKKGYPIQPSFVVVEGKGRYTVGHPAKAQVISNPKNTLFGVKRIIGRKYDSVEVDSVRKRVSYQIVPGANLEASVHAGGIQLTPSEVSGILLKNMKDVASEALGVEVKKAVVTVPAYFNHSQRKSTIEAGASAGLEILRLINEPTAAALAYGYRKEMERRILVFDLGGGTFDVSLLEVGNDVYEVVTTNGDTFLGGNDFDNVLVDSLIEKFRQAEGVDLRGDLMAMQRLKDAAERAKCELSFTDRTQVLIQHIHGNASLHADVTRQELEALTEPLIERCMAVVEKTLKEAGLAPNEVDDVILVGGQPRMPAIQAAITTLFGKAPSKGVHPDEAVAVGAAIHAASLGSDESGILLLDVTPFSLGIDSAGDLFTSVIQKNATIPVSEKRTFTTVRDNQTEVHIVVRQGESRKASENSFLGEFLLEGIAEAQRMSPKIDVLFRIDSNGILSVSAKDQNTGERQAIAIREYAHLATSGESAEREELERAEGSQDAATTPKKGGGGFFAKIAKTLSFRKKKAEAPVADEDVAATFDESEENHELPDVVLPPTDVEMGVAEPGSDTGSPLPAVTDLPEANALDVEAPPELVADSVPSVPPLQEELAIDPEDMEDGERPTGEALFAVSPPTATVGEVPVDPFTLDGIDDLLGGEWSPGGEEAVPEQTEAKPEKTEQIDLAALEAALSDLDFELPDDDADIDLDSLSTLTQARAVQEVTILPIEKSNEETFDGFSDNPEDPFGLMDMDDVEDDPFAIVDKSLAPPPVEADPFAIVDKSLAPPPVEADPFAIVDKSLAPPPVEDEPFAIVDKSLAPPPLEDDPFAIIDKADAVPPMEEDPFADLDLSALDDVEEDSDDLDPFGGETVRSTTDEVTFGFDTQILGDDDPIEGSLETLVTPPDRVAQGSDTTPLDFGDSAIETPSDSPFGEDESGDSVDDPFGIIDSEDFSLGALVDQGADEGAQHFEDVPPDPFSVFGEEAEPDPFGITEKEGEDDPFGITEKEGEDNPFGSTEKEGEDNPFGITEKEGEEDPFGMIEKDLDFLSPFGSSDDEESEGEDPFGVIDKDEAPPEDAALVETTIVLPKRGGPTDTAHVHQRYSRIDAFVKEGREILGQAGCFLNVADPLSVGSACEMTLSIPAIGESVELAGQVVWSSKGREADAAGMGIQFDFTQGDGRDKLESLLADLEG